MSRLIYEKTYIIILWLYTLSSLIPCKWNFLKFKVNHLYTGNPENFENNEDPA